MNYELRMWCNTLWPLNVLNLFELIEISDKMWNVLENVAEHFDIVLEGNVKRQNSGGNKKEDKKNNKDFFNNNI